MFSYYSCYAKKSEAADIGLQKRKKKLSCAEFAESNITLYEQISGGAVVEDIAMGAEGLRFVSRAGKIEHCVANN